MSAAYHYYLALVLAIIGVIALALDNYLWMILSLVFVTINVRMGWREENNDHDEA